MKIACPGCKATYSIDDGRIPPSGLNMKCPRCSAIFAVRLSQGASQQAPTPLPGPTTSATKAPPAGPPPGLGAVVPPGPPPGLGAVVPPGPPPGLGAVVPPGPPPGLGAVVPPGPPPGLGAVVPPGPPPGPGAPVPLPGRAEPHLAGVATDGAIPLPPPPAPQSGVFDAFAAVGGLPSRPQENPPDFPSLGGNPFETLETDPFSAVQEFPEDPLPLPGIPPPPGQGRDAPSATISLRADHGQGDPAPVPLPGAALPDLAFDDSAPLPPPPPDLGFDFGSVDFAPPPPPPVFDDEAGGGPGDLAFEFDPAAPSLPPNVRRPFPDAISASHAVQATFHVRKRSGEKLGTFPVDSIREMIAAGELDGDDVELSRDGNRWLPPAQTQGFGPPVVSRKAVPPQPRSVSRPVPVVESQPQAQRPEASPQGKAPTGDRIGAAREAVAARLGRLGPRQWALAAGVAFCLSGGVLELATPWGFWFHRSILGTGSVTPTAPKQPVTAQPQKAGAPTGGQTSSAGALEEAQRSLAEGRAEEAVAVLEKAHGRDKGNVDVAVALGRALLLSGKMLQADELVSSLGQSHPKDPRVVHLRASLAQAGGKTEEALAFFHKALELSEEPLSRVEIYLGLADTLLGTGDLEKARASIDTALEAAPDHPGALTALARIRLRAGDAAGARAALEKAIVADPTSLPAQLAQAEILQQEGELGAAKVAWEAVLAMDPKRVDAWVQLGTVLGRLGDRQGAIHSLEKARALEPQNASLLARLGAVQFDGGKADEAVSTLEAAIARDGSLPEPWLVLSKIKLGKGDPVGAIQAARKALSLDERSPEAAFQLGLAYQRSNAPADALEAFQTAVELDPDHADALQHSGEAYMTLNVLDKAVESFERALRLDPSRTRLLLAVADCHLRSNRWDQAIAVLKRAQKDKGLRGVSFRLGLAFQEKGRPQDAIGWFQAAAEEDPTDARPWRQLGYAYKERNRIGDAVSAFRRYLERSPAADDKVEIEDEIATLRL